MKNSIIDIKNSKNNINPDNGYVRLKTGPDNSLQVLYSDGRKRTITHAWELPVETVEITDPSTLTLVDWGRYLIPTGAVGDWSGHEQEIATWNSIDSVWEFITPEQGWGAYVKAANQIYTFDGTKWTKLTASQTIIEVTYDELRLLIRNKSLIPGNLYKITDMQTYNEIMDGSGIIHTSQTFELLIEAVTNDTLSGTATDLNNINDLVVYNPSMAAPGWFYIDAYYSDNSINDDDYGFNEGFIFDFNNAPYFEVTFIDNKHVKLGLDTILDDSVNIIIGNGGSYSTVHANGVDAIWHEDTGILELLGSYVFDTNSSGTRGFINLGAKFAAKELRKGRILERHDLVNNIDFDFDFRNYKFGLYRAEIDFFNGGNSWYCSPRPYQVKISNPRLDLTYGNTTRYIVDNIDTNDYVLKDVLTYGSGIQIKNLTVKNTRYTIFENVNIDTFSLLGGKSNYFYNTYIRYSEVHSANGAIILTGSQLINTKINELTTMLQNGYVKDCEIGRIDRCLIHNMVNCKFRDSVWHLQMNDDTRLFGVTGNIGVVSMHDNSRIDFSELTMSNVIVQNNSILQYFTRVGGGNFSQIMLDNTKLTRVKFHVPNTQLFRFVYFENLDITDLELIGKMEGVQGSGNQVYFPLIDTSVLKGEVLEEAFPGMEIHNNTIVHNDSFILPPININIDCDVSTSYMDLELPHNPYNGLEYRFTDIMGLSNTNNITINVATTPDAGIVNTINGIANKVIDTKYGVLIIKYSDVGGWIIVQESIVQIPPNKTDNITIEKHDGFNIMSSEPTIQEAIDANWVPGMNGATFLEHSTFHNGRMDCHPGTSAFFEITNNNPSWPAGTYEFYSNIDLTPYGVGHWVGSLKYYTSVYENGLYRHTITLASGDDPSTLECLDTPLDTPASIWFINRFDTSTSPEITIKGIDWIIGSDDASIDGSHAPSSEPDKEIPTKKYVDVNKDNPDDVTLTRLPAYPQTSTNSDLQLVFNEAWDSSAPTSNWTLQGTTTFNNGVFTIPAGTDPSATDSGIVVRNTSGTNWNGGYFKIVTNIDFITSGYTIEIRNPSGDAPSESKGYNQTLLENGKYEISLYLGAEGLFYELYVYLGAVVTPTPDDINIEIVLMEFYPPRHISKIKEIDYIIDDDNESVDGSNTPMINAHKELVTRAYTDLNQLTKKPLRLIEIVNDIALNGNQTIDGISTVNGDRVGVFAQTTSSEDGFYIVNDSGNWTRTKDLPLGYKSAGVVFETLEGNSNQNTTWVINNDETNDVVGTNNLDVTQTYSMANIQWQFTNGDRLTPVNSSVEGIEIINNHNDYTWLTMQNTNTGNMAGAIVELHKSNTAYQDNIYFGIYSDNFWIPILAGNGALMTDQNIVIGTVDNTKEIRFILGNDYSNIIQVGKITTNGFSLESLKTASSHPASGHHNVMVDSTTGFLYASDDNANAIKTYTTTLTATDISNKYIDLGESISNIVNFNISGAPTQSDGIDFEIDSGNDNYITWNGLVLDGELIAGDVVTVKYF